MSLFPSVTYPATLDNVCLFILYRNKVILNKEKRCYTMFHYTSRGTFWIFPFSTTYCVYYDLKVMSSTRHWYAKTSQVTNSNNFAGRFRAKKICAVIFAPLLSYICTMRSTIEWKHENFHCQNAIVQ